jgi:hypothetical protein
MRIKILKLIRDQKLDPEKIIPILEQGIEQEMVSRDAHQILGDDTRYLYSEERIIQSRFLLSLLRCLSRLQ